MCERWGGLFLLFLYYHCLSPKVRFAKARRSLRLANAVYLYEIVQLRTEDISCFWCQWVGATRGTLIGVKSEGGRGSAAEMDGSWEKGGSSERWREESLVCAGKSPRTTLSTSVGWRSSAQWCCVWGWKCGGVEWKRGRGDGEGLLWGCRIRSF